MYSVFFAIFQFVGGKKKLWQKVWRTYSLQLRTHAWHHTATMDFFLAKIYARNTRNYCHIYPRIKILLFFFSFYDSNSTEHCTTKYVTFKLNQRNRTKKMFIPKNRFKYLYAHKFQQWFDNNRSEFQATKKNRRIHIYFTIITIFDQHHSLTSIQLIIKRTRINDDAFHAVCRLVRSK